MFLIFFALVYIVAQVCAQSTTLVKYEKNGDKLVLKPVELIDLIMEERVRKEIPLVKHHHEADSKLTDNQLSVEATEAVFIANSGNRGVGSRKVWSRWSKWGECSATCGVGATVRRRLCVAGRCARGEREEQRRSCLRSPCTPTTDNLEHRDNE